VKERARSRREDKSGRHQRRARMPAGIAAASMKAK